MLFSLIPNLHLNQLIVTHRSTHRSLSPFSICYLVDSLVMDPFSIATGVVGILGCVTKLSTAISRFKDDYKFADADLDIARQHALLLKEEIRALESKNASHHPPPHKSAAGQDGFDRAAESSDFVLEDTSFAKAMSTACELLSTIEASFPLRSEPHTWRRKMRWAMKDKQVLLQVKERLNSAESTLQGIVAMEQL